MQVGYLLTEMKKRRVIADYLLEQDVPPEDAVQQLRTANHVNEILSALA
jgi:hypothetical protein